MISSDHSLSEVEELLHALIVDYAEMSGGWYVDIQYDLWHRIHSSNEYDDAYIKTILNDIEFIESEYNIWFVADEFQFKFVPSRVFRQMYEEWLMDKSIP